MASMQCYRSCSSERYETNKHQDNSSFTHKVTDMVGKVFNGGNNHNNNNNNNNQSLCHGQATQQAHHHNNNNHLHQGQYGAGGAYGHHGNHQGNNNNNHSHKPGQCGAGCNQGNNHGHNHKVGQCGAGCTCNHGNNHGHNNNKACSSEQYGNGNYEVRKMKTTVRNSSHSRRNRNCDDGSDSSGSDSD